MPGPIVTELPKNTTTKGSRNKPIIGALVSTLQRKVEPEKLYDALRKMNEDLNAAYEALFDGPLPAVDGYFLTRLNAAVLTGIIPPEYHIAYTNVINVFTDGQKITEPLVEEPFWEMGIGDTLADPVVDPVSFFRSGGIADGDFYLSSNFLWDGAAWNKDDGATGAGYLEFFDGILSWNWYDPVLLAVRKTHRFEGRDFVSESFDQLSSISLICPDDKDVVRLGNSADGATPSQKGWPAVPVAVVANFPPGSADANGIIGINKTSNRFIFYANGNRYFVAGTAF